MENPEDDLISPWPYTSAETQNRVLGKLHEVKELLDVKIKSNPENANLKRHIKTFDFIIDRIESGYSLSESSIKYLNYVYDTYRK